jgi:hypothetical protein
MVAKTWSMHGQHENCTQHRHHSPPIGNHRRKRTRPKSKRITSRNARLPAHLAAHAKSVLSWPRQSALARPTVASLLMPVISYCDELIYVVLLLMSNVFHDYRMRPPYLSHTSNTVTSFDDTPATTVTSCYVMPVLSCNVFYDYRMRPPYLSSIRRKPWHVRAAGVEAVGCSCLFSASCNDSMLSSAASYDAIYDATYKSALPFLRMKYPTLPCDL